MAKAKNAVCACNWGWIIVALVLFTLGLYALVGGIATQWNSPISSANAGMILGWYFAGFLLLALGKMSKCKAHAFCPQHGWKK